MIKSVDLPGTIFNDYKELIKEVKKNKDIIIAEKKAQIYKSIDKGLAVSVNQEYINKQVQQTKSIELDSNYYYFVVNSSNFLDSHNDLHIEGNWEKSAKEQKGKCFFIFDHVLKRDEIIAMKEDIEMFTATIPFKALGKDFEGDTYCLIYKIAKNKIVNKQAKEWLDSGYSFECSVRMQYMDIELATNPEFDEDEKSNEFYNKYYSSIVNKNDFDKIPYFWIIKQAKNVLESSWVMFGSNGATGLIQENKSEAETLTPEKSEPSVDTQKLKEELVKLLTKFD